MYYVYVLRSEKSQKFYIGSTGDLKKRFYQHNHGDSASTKAYAPWNLLYYEAFTTKALAVNREHRLKHHGRGFVELKKRIGFC